MDPREKNLWKNKYKRTPAEDIIKQVKSRQQHRPGSGQNVHPIILSNVVPASKPSSAQTCKCNSPHHKNNVTNPKHVNCISFKVGKQPTKPVNTIPIKEQLVPKNVPLKTIPEIQVINTNIENSSRF